MNRARAEQGYEPTRTRVAEYGIPWVCLCGYRCSCLADHHLCQWRSGRSKLATDHHWSMPDNRLMGWFGE